MKEINEYMGIKKGDYVCGVEDILTGKREINGWVGSIQKINGNIVMELQADDEYDGYRGTLISTADGKIVKLEPKARPNTNRV